MARLQVPEGNLVVALMRGNDPRRLRGMDDKLSDAGVGRMSDFGDRELKPHVPTDEVAAGSSHRDPILLRIDGEGRDQPQLGVVGQGLLAEKSPVGRRAVFTYQVYKIENPLFLSSSGKR